MRRRILSTGAVALVAGGALLRGVPESGDPTSAPLPLDTDSADVTGRANRIGLQHGLLIGFGDPGGFYVPPFTPADAAIPGGSAMPAAITDVAPALDGIAVSLNRYPPGFVRRFCHAIFLCGTLYFGEERAGGTYGPAWIILAADPVVGPAGIRETARLGVHHELSSLILQQNPGLGARWTGLLPPGWRPVARTDDALRRAGREEEQDGFLSAYAETSAENDFNTYAETAFGDPERLATLARRSPTVRRKARLLLSAYVALEERLTGTFRASGLDDLLPEAAGKDLARPRP